MQYYCKYKFCNLCNINLDIFNFVIIKMCLDDSQ